MPYDVELDEDEQQRQRMQDAWQSALGGVAGGIDAVIPRDKAIAVPATSTTPALQVPEVHQRLKDAMLGSGHPATPAPQVPQGDHMVKDAMRAPVRSARSAGPPVMSGGIAGVANMPPKAPAPAAGSPAPPMSVPGSMPGGEARPDLLKDVLSNTRMPQAPPQNPALTDLMRQRAQTGDPLDKRAIDPATGKPKYRMGFGQRLLGTFANAATGFAKPGSAPVEYVGPGATNARYAQDEAMRQGKLKNLDTQIGQQEKLNEENRKMFDSATKMAYESQIGNAREQTSRAQQETAAARQSAAEAQQQKADVAQELADQKTREITYDEKRKRFLQNGKIYVPKTIEEGAALEAGNGVQGYYSKMWSQERKNRGGGLGDELAQERLERQREKNLSGVQKDVDAAVSKHKVGLEKRMKSLQDKLDLQEIDQKTFDNGMANIERDDYKGMITLGQQFASRSKRFGETVEPPKPEPWEKSYLSPDERARLMGNNSQPSPAAAPAQAKPQQSVNKEYKFNYKKGNTRIGSDDGVNWINKDTGKPYGGK